MVQIDSLYPVLRTRYRLTPSTHVPAQVQGRIPASRSPDKHVETEPIATHVSPLRQPQNTRSIWPTIHTDLQSSYPL